MANGQTVGCEGRTKAVPLHMQGYSYTIDFFILTLGGCDIVLGVQWLRTLGPILWDFCKLFMEFSILGGSQKLQGMASASTIITER